MLKNDETNVLLWPSSIEKVWKFVNDVNNEVGNMFK